MEIHIPKPHRVYDMNDPIDKIVANLRRVPISTIDLDVDLQNFIDKTAIEAADLIESMRNRGSK